MTDRLDVLLVEDDADDAALIRRMIERSIEVSIHLERVDRLSAARAALAERPFDLVLLDLGLPDAPGGVGTYERFQEIDAHLPVVVLTGHDDLVVGTQAVAIGAQDYLVKGDVNGPLLCRAIRYAIERHRMQEEIRGLSLVDELTGLCNRRGFLTLAREDLRRVRNRGGQLAVVYADLDGLKRINDDLGHEAGDQAIRDMADVLRQAFRESDVLGRLGGDEFAVLVAGAADVDEATVLARIEEALAHFAAGNDRPYRLSFSAGLERFDPARSDTLEDLLNLADTRMYARKRARRRV